MLLRSSLLALAAVLCCTARAAAQAPPDGTGAESLGSGGLALPLRCLGVAEDPGELHQAGTALEVAGDYLFVGAPGDGDGRVWVWHRGAQGYAFVQLLLPPPPLAALDRRFGRSLAADGDLLLVGTETAHGSGRVLVHRRQANGLYAPVQLLQPPNGGVAWGSFGEHLAVLEGELVAVSASGERSVHLFEAGANGHFPDTSTRVLTPVGTGTVPHASWMTGFGSTVALHRTAAGSVSVLIGMRDACFYQDTQAQAPDESTPNAYGTTAARTGGVAVVRESGGAWRLAQRLIPDWSKMKDFGFEISVDGSRVGVGAIYSRVYSGGKDAGTASVYAWNGSRFALVDTVWPSFPFQSGLFGYALDFCGDYLLVGQPQHWGGVRGLVEVFRITPSGLVPVDLIVAPDGNGAADPNALGDCFGREIVCNARGDVIVAAPFSAPGAGAPPQYAGGALYLFR